MFQSVSRQFLTFFLLLGGLGFVMEFQTGFQASAADRMLRLPERPVQTTPKKITAPVESLKKEGAVNKTPNQSSAPLPDYSFSASSQSDFADFTGSLDLLSSESIDWNAIPREAQGVPTFKPPTLPTLENSSLPPLRMRLPIQTVPAPQTPQRPVVSEEMSSSKRLEQILAEGTQLEEKQLWSDAILVYEKGLKNFPVNPALLERYRLCRYRVELGRRYHDATFEQLLLKTPLTGILKIYTDVFTQIHTNHIDSPDWKTLFGYGLDNFEIALTDKEFLQWNNIEVPAEKLESLRRKIRETSQPWSFREIQHMKDGVLNLAEIVQNEIGLHPSVILMEFVCGAAFGLDPHTSFLTLRQLNDFYSTIEGSFVGIGIEIDNSDPKSDVLSIAKVHPDSPAMKAGLKDGDSIFAVDGTSTAGLGIERAADLLQGEIGSAVVLQTRTPAGKEREVRIIRREIETTSVEDVHLIDGKVGYIRITCFQLSTTGEMKSALEILQRQGMKSLILDLRGNPGGVLPVTAEVADLFLDKGVIVRTQDRSNQSETVWRAGPTRSNTMPLYVLIDEESASASEILAGAIQDHKRGILIGHPSYGKGTVQVLHRLSGNETRTPLSGLKLTVERYYSPNGSSYCNVGVRPDIIIPGELEQTVVASKPDLTTGTIAQTVPKRKRITSSPNDPCVAEAIAIFHSVP